MVNKCRAELESTANLSQSAKRTGRDGRTTNTSKIGGKPPAPNAKPKKSVPAPEEPDPDPAKYHQQLDEEGEEPDDDLDAEADSDG